MGRKKKTRAVVLGDFASLEQQYNTGEITFDQYQAKFSESRFHGIQGNIMPFAVGGSDAPIIRGNSPWRTPLELYEEKTSGAKVDKPLSIEKRHRFDVGHIFEKGVGEMGAKLLSERLDAEVRYEPSTLQYGHPSYPHCAANIDGIFWIDGEPYLGEIKTTGYTSAWIDYFSQELIPPHYVDQVYFYLGICDFFKGAVVVASKGLNAENDFSITVVDRDDKLSKEILKDCERFVKNAEKGIKPNLDDVSNLSLKVNELIYLYKEEDISAPPVFLPKKAKATLDEIKEIQKEISELNTEEYKQIGSKIKKLQSRSCLLSKSLIEFTKDGTKGIYRDKDSYFEVNVNKSNFSFDKEVKDYFKEKYPEVYADISSYKPSPKVEVKYDLDPEESLDVLPF